jgi:hypothetical protein
MSRNIIFAVNSELRNNSKTGCMWSREIPSNNTYIMTQREDQVRVSSITWPH